MEKIRMTSGKFKETWEWNNFGFEGKDASEFSWPPRQFTCSFCKRKFRSAQALGGHMNVHRRDRAMLRQPPSWVVQCPNANPNPNPNYLSSASSVTCPPPHTLNSFLSLSLTSFSSLSSTSTDEEKMRMITGSRCNRLSPRTGDITKKSSQALPRVGKLKGYVQEDEFKVLNNGEIVRLDLEMGLLRDSKEGLDLELRLGYS